MRRREFIIAASGALMGPTVARGQQADRVRRIGVLSTSLLTPVSAAGYPIFIAQLRQLGFSEGANLAIDFRALDQNDNRKPFADAIDMRGKVDLIVALGSEVFVQAAVAADKSVPIVMTAFNFDPIARGYVKSLARPGGNITGVTFRQPELASKQIELLQEAFPTRKRLAVFYDEQSADQFSAAEVAAKLMRLDVLAVKLERPPYDFDKAFQSVSQGRAEALLVLSSGYFSAHRAQIALLAAQQRLPTMFIFKPYVESGGLMSYGVDFLPSYQRAAEYVAKILRGAKPGDLPVEQVTSFELVVNLKTARAIGVELPTSILLRANTVIE
jgi:putative ABC transport system substrate-binding protein